MFKQDFEKLHHDAERHPKRMSSISILYKQGTNCLSFEAKMSFDRMENLIFVLRQIFMSQNILTDWSQDNFIESKHYPLSLFLS